MIDYDAKGEDLTQMGRDWLAKVTRYQPNVGGYEAQAGEVRICFAVAYYTDPETAKAAGEYSKANNTYNGGMYHGSPCGRDPSFDVKWQGLTYHAVTH